METDLVRTKDNLNNRQKCYGVWFIVIPCDSGKEKRSEKSSTIKCLLNLLFFNWLNLSLNECAFTKIIRDPYDI